MDFDLSLGGPFVEMIFEKILGRILRKKLSVGGELVINDLEAHKGADKNVRINADITLSLSQNDILNILKNSGII